ncbi:SPFH domain-containing protein [Wohlfahrtiimonas chitiniclastica]|uniref:SPFH domain-containing protein n=1 Tax=Wohlfahrtiimonas chitiniclastica TaxID=400946 RepID=UPI001BD10223|nr:SPFH domain-containing protein [Wohlfahrtiimonas chitiniclastica]MBS7815652.1 SPFH domain-containing protein [Wohlfahrtiimonas chitiniclastica]MBS7817398.1 SPFH domain-containing protein [Wohlfahrtiimonas chitiniclastica]MBS7821546.1 SPFH domain-containing protein [Wohlfahrtiimonas chitiniclastica]MBS7823534.1 SPFH domain-containing protein [Wohlfahrtiimonas chitiniclastica]MBS7831348.1 SPFH domain-containing protein [Wohlfahrtiimonas chitiniclastica]
MGLGRFIRKQFIDVIQWPEPDPALLMWQFPVDDQEIQNGASLIVRESQVALFVNEGRLADAFPAGSYQLTTNNLPILTNLQNWSRFFESPFKSDVYFFNTKQQMARGWGTAQPITIRDNEFGLVSIRSFGTYSYRIVDVKKFFTEIAGITDAFYAHQLDDQLRNVCVTTLSSILGNKNIPFIDMAANLSALSKLIEEALQAHFAALGLQLEGFLIESITLPPALQKTLDERISMGIIGDLSKYTQYQMASSIPLAAQNEGGAAGVGMSMGAGLSMGQMMAEAMSAPKSAPQTNTAPSNPHTAKLSQLNELLQQGLITAEDYEKAKAEVLKQLIG